MGEQIFYVDGTLYIESGHAEEAGQARRGQVTPVSGPWATDEEDDICARVGRDGRGMENAKNWKNTRNG